MMQRPFCRHTLPFTSMDVGSVEPFTPDSSGLIMIAIVIRGADSAAALARDQILWSNSMIMITTHVDDAAGVIPGGRIAGATFDPPNHRCVVSYKGRNGETLTQAVTGQDGADLFNALRAIQAITITMVTPSAQKAAEDTRKIKK
jgi:hypothetical protein